MTLDLNGLYFEFKQSFKDPSKMTLKDLALYWVDARLQKKIEALELAENYDDLGTILVGRSRGQHYLEILIRTFGLSLQQVDIWQWICEAKEFPGADSALGIFRYTAPCVYLESVLEAYNVLVSAVVDRDLVQQPSGLIRMSDFAEWVAGKDPILEGSIDVDPLSTAAAPYLEDLFELTNASYFRFWKDWTEGSPRPKEGEAVEWLMKMDPRLTKQKARAIFELSRPPEAHKPGAPKASNP